MDGNKCDSAGTLLLYYFARRHAFIVYEPHKINAAEQAGYVQLCLGLGELAGDELLTTNIHYG